MTKDYHFWRVADAIRDVELAIGEARVTNPIHAEFITGNGQIKKAVLRLLDDYGIEGREKLGNPGTIIAELV